uniref:Ion transport domain-containing protein n=1 Tax=Zooxanthella nutricula TaxID=1333877 RepID=A0A7S2KC66_9DINO
MLGPHNSADRLARSPPSPFESIISAASSTVTCARASKRVEVLARWGLLVGSLLGENVGPKGASDNGPICADYEMRPCWLTTEADCDDTPIEEEHDVALEQDLPRQAPFYKLSASSLRPPGRLEGYVLHPSSQKRNWWALLGMVYLVWDIFLTPLQICDLDDFSASLVGLPIAVMMYWCLDLGVQSMTGFLTDDGDVEMRPGMTARRYLRGWFGTDILILLSDLVVFLLLDVGLWESSAGDGDTARASTSSLKMIRLARLIRLLRLMRLQQLRELSSNLANAVFSHSVLLVFTVCQWFLAIIALNHVVACAWYAIANYSSSEVTWARSVEVGAVEVNSKLQCYVLALHWSLTQFGPSTQNIGPTNTQERMFACAVVFVGLGVFSVIISGITSAVNQLRLVNMETVVEESNMRDFMTSRGLTATLYGSIASFFKNAYSKVDGRILEGDVKVFSQLPISLCMQMHEELYMPKLCTNAAFGMFYQQHHELLCRICHTAMSEHPVLAGHDVFLPTTEATHAYYSTSESLVYDHSAPAHPKGLNDFSMERRRRSISRRCEVLATDSWLAEMALWCKWMHRGHLQAKATTHVFGLDCREVEAIVIRADRGTIFGMRIFAILLVAEIERMELMGEVLNDLPVELDVSPGRLPAGPGG